MIQSAQLAPAIAALLDIAAPASSTRRMRNDNPYAPPQAEGGPAGDDPIEQTWLDASSGARFANFIIDQVVLYVLIFVVAFLLAVVGAAELGRFMGLPVMIGYYLFFEGLFQRTPGKLITGTKVVAPGGGKPSFGQIVGRTFARLVPFEPFSFLGAGSGWHDTWSNTRVVSAR